MNKSISLPEKQGPTNQPVTQVSDAWIMCRSKSYMGRVYYFNTLTGEAVWNLSSSEIEKAKTATRIMECEHGAQIDGCPEPAEPPLDHISPDDFYNRSHQNSQTKNYNRQTSHNRFVNHACPRSTYASQEYTNCNSVNHMGIGVSSATYNSNIWAVPPTSQIFIAPTVSPIVDHRQPSVSFACERIEHNTSVHNMFVPLSKRFNFNRAYNSTSIKRGGMRKSPKFQRHKYGHMNKYSNSWNSKTDDLRSILSAKRRIQYDEQVDYKDITNGQNLEDSLSRAQIIQDEPVHVVANNIQETLDTTPLRNLAFSGAKENCWYMVPDPNILIHNLNYLKVLFQSDKEMRLMIPQSVLSEVQKSSNVGTLRVIAKAHAAMSFISEQIDVKRVFIDEMSDESIDIDLLACCYKLVKENYHVVLLTNNMKLQTKKNNISVPLFTIIEIQEFLESYSEKQLRETVILNNSDVKIVIPNDRNREINKNCTITKFYETRSEETSDNSNNTDTLVKKEIKIQTEVIPPKKVTIDTGVQTDFSDVDLVYKESSSEKVDQNISTENVLFSSSIPKPRAIRLKRSFTSDRGITTLNKNEKKPFKWSRKRKQIVANVDNSVNKDEEIFQKDIISSNNDDTEFRNVEYDIHGATQSKSDYTGDDVGSETCNYVQKNNTNEKIVIEDSSTSDIISNSLSNVDCESVVRLNQQLPNTGDKVSKHVMFEVTGTIMEESLEMKCDEWISRFVQIMEEALTQVLIHNTCFLPIALPPPWSLHEATECIKKSFTDNEDIFEASNKLSTILFKISDGRGKININVKPNEFMEMYSYGVYLIDTLQVAISNCEDLQNAAESLLKLLNDIQKPTSDGAHNESFTEPTHEPSMQINDTTLISQDNDLNDTSISESQHDSSNKTNLNESRESSKKYNLRKRNVKKPEQRKESLKSVEINTNLNVESVFFTSLSLQKKVNNSILKETELNTIPETKKQQSGMVSSTPNREDVNSINIIVSDIDNNRNPNNTNGNAEPKIIRNFVKFAEFENRIKKYGQDVFLEELDDLGDHSEKKSDNEREKADDNEETSDTGQESNCEIEEVYHEDEEYDEYSESEYEECNSNKNQEVHRTDSNLEKNETQCDEHSNKSSEIHIDYNSNFKSFVGGILHEMQQAFIEVNKFCNETYKEMNDEEPNLKRKSEINERAERTYSHIDNLCKSLNSIIVRDSNLADLRAVLVQGGLEEYLPTTEECSKYRNVITKCLDTAESVLESVKLIMDSTKEN